MKSQDDNDLTSDFIDVRSDHLHEKPDHLPSLPTLANHSAFLYMAYSITKLESRVNYKQILLLLIPAFWKQSQKRVLGQKQ